MLKGEVGCDGDVLDFNVNVDINVDINAESSASEGKQAYEALQAVHGYRRVL